ncbi:LADA_0D10154g1_1 [Lachancea dasiensis]|uniref:LADA_0D10154g1_1 n=1 Tax=Lachancea dasiensis TaxID=1072105 RepID=A0A1G4J7H1_9SACH|nr:LADA_0D10154g1_1 [Lachancea dasiensis]
MYTKEFRTSFGHDLELDKGSVLELSAVHFINKVVLQIRLNGELDTCLEVISKGLPAESMSSTPLGLQVMQRNEDQIDMPMLAEDCNDNENEINDFTPVEDSLSNFHIITRLGDSNDMKLPIVCCQIAELYQKVIFLSNVDNMRDVAPTRDFVISLSAKIWKSASPGRDFSLLIFILTSIKEMYKL